MKKVFLFSLLAVVWIIAANSSKEQLEKDNNYAKTFKENIITDMGGIKKHWAKLTLDYTENSFHFNITYKENFSEMTVAIAENKQIIRLTLKRLLADGKNLSGEELIFIRATALQKAGKGETGNDLVKVLGTARYNHEKDQIEFEYYKSY